MNLNQTGKKLLSLTIPGFMALQGLAHADEINLQHVAIKETLPAPAIKTQEYFVRLKSAPMSQWEHGKKVQGLTVNHKDKLAYKNILEDEISKVAASFRTAGFKVGNIAKVSDAGFSIHGTPGQIKAMKDVSGVQSIIPKQRFNTQRDHSTPWIGGDMAHSLGYLGKGQVIAIIDTGIDYLHLDFNGTLDYETNDPTYIEAGSFPTERVVGGYDFAGYDYDASSEDPDSYTPKPDEDPFDDGRHGTHVAGIAGGGGIEGILGAGIAPEASLFALKVFGASGSTSVVADALEMAMDPNGDGDLTDAVDVINLSLGSPFGHPLIPSAVAAQNASDSGIVVVASAGNSGNGIPFVSGSPGSAEDVIAVASTIAGGALEFFIPFTSESGNTYEFFAKYGSISPDLEGVISGDLVAATPFDACSPLDTELTGKIAFITRGSCAFTSKLQNALDAGAIGAVVMNNVPGAAITMGGSAVDLAGAMISLEDGQTLLAELGMGSVSSELAPTNTKEYTEDDDTMSSFSSRGPGPTGLFKPDLAAPGSSIKSALSGSGDGTLTISGTSMAAPQVAGMAALLREKFPELGPKAIKAIMQNTASPAKVMGVPGATPPLSLQGAGIVNIEKALAATSYAAPGGIGFGRVTPEYNGAVTRYLTIHNMSDSGKRYRISHAPNQSLPEGAANLSFNSEVYVGAGQSQAISVTLYLNAQAMESKTGFNEMDGWLLISSEGETMRVGYMAVVDPASRLNYSAQQNIVRVRNDAFGDARVYPYTLAQQNAPDESIDSIESFGFRSVSEESVAFGLNANTDWNNFSSKIMTMSIDVDEDLVPDYTVTVADLQVFNGSSDPTGTLVSAISSSEGELTLLYYANADFNNSVLQFQLDAYGSYGFLADGDTNFDYEINISDRTTGIVGTSLTGSVDLSQQASFDVSGLLVPAQESGFVTVDGQAPTLWLSPTELGGRRSVVR